MLYYHRLKITKLGKANVCGHDLWNWLKKQHSLKWWNPQSLHHFINYSDNWEEHAQPTLHQVYHLGSVSPLGLPQQLEPCPTSDPYPKGISSWAYPMLLWQLVSQPPLWDTEAGLCLSAWPSSWGSAPQLSPNERARPSSPQTALGTSVPGGHNSRGNAKVVTRYRYPLEISHDASIRLSEPKPTERN